MLLYSAARPFTSVNSALMRYLASVSCNSGMEAKLFSLSGSLKNQSNLTLCNVIVPPFTTSVVTNFPLMLTLGLLDPSHDTRTVDTVFPVASETVNFCCTNSKSSLYEEQASVGLPHSPGLSGSSSLGIATEM